MASIFDRYAHIIFHRDYVANTVSMEWVGGDLALISDELMAQADPSMLQVDGDTVTICGVKCRILGPGPFHDSKEIERINAQ